MKKFLELTEQMLEKNASESIVEVDVEVPKKIATLYQQVYERVFNMLMSIYRSVEQEDIKHSEFFFELMGQEIFTEEEVKRKLSQFLRDRIYIAGGSLSDLIVQDIHGIEVQEKDIDIFIDFNLMDGLNKNLKLSNELEGEKLYLDVINKIFDIDLLNNFNYKNEFKDPVKVELSGRETVPIGYSFDQIKYIFNLNFGEYKIDIVSYEFNGHPEYEIRQFDFTFRMFYYNGGKIRGLKSGLDDIKAKVLKIQNPSTPYSSFVRGIDFESRYGYKMDMYSKIILITQFRTYSLRHFIIDYKKIIKTNLFPWYGPAYDSIDELVDDPDRTSFQVQKRVLFEQVKSEFNDLLLNVVGKKYTSLKEIQSKSNKYLDEFYNFVAEIDVDNLLKLHYLYYSAVEDSYPEDRLAMEFFFENDMHLFQLTTIDYISDFSLDFKNALDGKKLFTETLTNRVNEIKQILETTEMLDIFIGKNFRDSLKVLKTDTRNINEAISKVMEDEFGGQFVTKSTKRYLPEVVKYYLCKNKREYIKEQLENGGNTDYGWEMTPIFANKIKLSVSPAENFFRTGQLVINLRYNRDFDVKEKDLITEFDLFEKIAHLKGERPVQEGLNLQKDGGDREYKGYHYKRYLKFISGEGVYLDYIGTDYFHFINGSRFKKLEKKIKEMFGEKYKGFVTNEVRSRVVKMYDSRLVMNPSFSELSKLRAGVSLIPF